MQNDHCSRICLRTSPVIAPQNSSCREYRIFLGAWQNTLHESYNLQIPLPSRATQLPPFQTALHCWHFRNCTSPDLTFAIPQLPASSQPYPCCWLRPYWLCLLCSFHSRLVRRKLGWWSWWSPRYAHPLCSGNLRITILCVLGYVHLSDLLVVMKLTVLSAFPNTDSKWSLIDPGKIWLHGRTSGPATHLSFRLWARRRLPLSLSPLIEGFDRTRHWDIVSAFLHGNLDLEVFMQQLQGFVDGTNRVCRLCW